MYPSLFLRDVRRKAVLFLSMLLVLNCIPAALSADNSVVTASCSQFFSDSRVPVYLWSKPGIRPKAIVFALHGGAMHGRSFNTLGRKLSDQNCCVVSLDMRGYGKWFHCGTKKERKFNYKKTISDVYQVIRRLKKAYPFTPIVCLGESLGANMALFIAGDSPELINGVIAISPFSSPRLFLYPHMLVHLVQVAMNPMGRLDMSPYLKRRLAYDKQRALRHLKDPLGRNRLSAGELVHSCIFNLKGKRKARFIPAYMPVLFIVGERDRLCSVKGAQRLFARVPSLDKTLVLVKEEGHLMVETSNIRPKVLNTIIRWLDDHRGNEIRAGNPDQISLGVKPPAQVPSG